MLAENLTQHWRRNMRRLLNLRAGISRRRLKPLRVKFYDNLWREAAAEIGAEVTPASNGLLQVRLKDQLTFVRQTDLMLDSEITLNVFANKALHYDLIQDKSLRLAPFKRFTLETLETAQAFLRDQTGPVVIKPADGTAGGHGVTTGITNPKALKVAARHAAGFNQQLLVEQQLTGTCYRLIYFNGEFIDAVRRESPVVVGDGKSTIAELIHAENRSRIHSTKPKALNPLNLDQECRNTLKSQHQNPRLVPILGQSVRVKLAVNENAAPQNHVVRNIVHKEIQTMGAQLVRDFGIKFAGLDLTSDDISLPYRDGNTFFNEINVNPAIHHHYFIANPAQSASVAPRLLDEMFSQQIGVMKV